MKDNFSTQAQQYSQFRPTYPDELFHFVLSLAPAKTAAWDCGTGNGQVAVKLADYFQMVYGTDISQSQLNNAVAKSNIIYKTETAENTAFADNQFDLITVAQAIHWFDFSKFYREVTRTARHNGILAIMGYALLKIDAGLDPVINYLYTDILGGYWDKERRYIDEQYQTIPFPFTEISSPEFTNQYQWTLAHLIGYLNTWSAVQHYIKQKQSNPVALIQTDLEQAWGPEQSKTIYFPILLRIGQIQKS